MDIKTNAKAGYDAAIKMIDKEARSIWTFFGAMVAVNAILITLTAASHSPLLKLNEKVPALPAVIFRHIGATAFSALRSQPIFGVMEPVRFRHIGASRFSA